MASSRLPLLLSFFFPALLWPLPPAMGQNVPKPADPPKTVKDILDQLGTLKLTAEKDPPALKDLVDAAATAQGATTVYMPGAAAIVKGAAKHADGKPVADTVADAVANLSEPQLRVFLLSQGLTLITDKDDLGPAIATADDRLGKGPAPAGSAKKKPQWHIAAATGELAALRMSGGHWKNAADLFALADDFAGSQDAAAETRFSQTALPPLLSPLPEDQVKLDEKPVKEITYTVLQQKVAGQLRNSILKDKVLKSSTELLLLKGALATLAKGPPSWQSLRDNSSRTLKGKDVDGKEIIVAVTEEDWKVLDEAQASGMGEELKTLLLRPVTNAVAEAAESEDLVKVMGSLAHEKVNGVQEYYPSCGTAVTLRSPLAVLMIPEIISRLKLQECFDEVPMDGAGHFVLSFPLAHAWSQAFKYYRPYDLAGTNPPLSVDGVLASVSSVVDNYKGDKGVKDKTGGQHTPTDAVSLRADASSSSPIIFPKSQNFGAHIAITPGMTDADKEKKKKSLDSVVQIIVAASLDAVKASVKPSAKSLRGGLADAFLNYKPAEKEASAKKESLLMQGVTLDQLTAALIKAQDGGAAASRASVGANVEHNPSSMGRFLVPLAADVPLSKQQVADLQDQRITREADVPRTPAAAVASTAPLPAVAIPGLVGGSVTADVANNTLLLVVPQFKPADVPDFLHTIDALVTQLDQPSDMVEVSVAIVDVVATKAEEWGVRFASLGRGPVGSHTGFGAAGFDSPVDAIDATKNNGALSNILSPLSGGAPSLTSSAAVASGLNVGSLIVGNTVKLAATLHALEAKGDGQALSRPSVLTMDNTEAIVTEETKLYLPAKGLNTGVLSEVPVGLSLAVTPQVMYSTDDAGHKSARSVRLRVRLKEGDSGKTSTDVNGIVSVDNSQMKTLAVVGEGQSLLVAGRLRQQESQSENRVPLLGRIPLVGLAFKHKDVNRQKRQRLVLITPTIVTPGMLSSDLERQAARAFGGPPPASGK